MSSNRHGPAERGRLSLVASKSGRDGSIRINQDTDLWFAKFSNGEAPTHELRPSRHAWIGADTSYLLACLKQQLAKRS